MRIIGGRGIEDLAEGYFSFCIGRQNFREKILLAAAKGMPA